MDYDELAELAFKAEPGAGGITLVPYFDGERTPNRPDATASLTGLTLHNTTKENLARAFVEGLLCSQRDCLELIRSLGAEINRILLIGGGAKSVAIRTLAPSILGMDVTRPATDEYVAIGAAPSGRLGAVRRGRTADLAAHHRGRGDRRAHRSRVRGVRQGPRLIRCQQIHEITTE